MSFSEFCREAWEHTEPTNLEWIWYHEVLASELEKAALDRRDGSQTELCLELPPGTTKSMIVSVLFPSWVWTFWPQFRVISSTYEENLALYHAEKQRDLVMSDWYQERWPLKLAIGGGAKKYFKNEFGGFRRAIGTGGAITGFHAHCHIGDDLVKEQEAYGSQKSVVNTMEAASQFWFSTLNTRNIEPGKTLRILSGQRLTVADPQERARKLGYKTICFPMEYIKDDRTDPLDQRTIEGSLLHPSRHDERFLERMRIQLGIRRYNAQFQERPQPFGGYILLPEYLANRYFRLPSEIQETLEKKYVIGTQTWITSWDMSFRGLEIHDWVVGQVWCMVENQLWLVDQVRAQAGFREARAMVLDLAKKYPFIYRHIFENAANAPAIEDDLTNVLPGCELVSHGGGCLARTQAIEGIWYGGCIYLPIAEWMGGYDGFIQEHLNFSGSKLDTDDQVSASSLAIKYLTMDSNSIEVIASAMAEIRAQRMQTHVNL